MASFRTVRSAIATNNFKHDLAEPYGAFHHGPLANQMRGQLCRYYPQFLDAVDAVVATGPAPLRSRMRTPARWSGSSRSSTPSRRPSAITGRGRARGPRRDFAGGRRCSQLTERPGNTVDEGRRRLRPECRSRQHGVANGTHPRRGQRSSAKTPMGRGLLTTGHRRATRYP